VKNRRRAAILWRCVWDTQPLSSVPKTRKKMWVLCAVKKKAQRSQHILRSCSLHYSQLSLGVPCWLASVVSLVCEIKSWDFHTKNEHDQESAIPAELPCLPVMTCHAHALPPWPCCMPACADVRGLALLDLLDWRASLPESCSAQLLVP
jgi:hypothetical protein